MKALEALLLAAVGFLCSRLSRLGAGAAAAAHVPFQPSVTEQLLFTYAVVFGLLAMASLALARRGQSLIGLLRAECKAEMAGFAATEGSGRLARSHLLALVFLVGVGVVVRIAFIDQPMRYDESVSFLVFVNETISRAFYYPVPNNHVLNTLLEKLSCAVVGTSPVAIRLPAFIAGVALAPSLFGLCRKIDPQGGLLAAAGAAVTPFLILYSTNGRGYALLCLLTVLLIRQSLCVGGKQVSCRWGITALLSALGMWVMPSMLFVVASVGLWVTANLALDSVNGPRRALAYALAYGSATGLLTLMLYTPVVLASGGFESLLFNRFVRSLPSGEFAAGIVPHWVETFGDFSRDIPWPIVAAVVISAFGGTVVAARAGQRALALLLPAFVIGTFGVFLAKRSIPFTRTWIFLIPIALICADAGVCWLMRRLTREFQLALTVAICVGATAIAGNLIATDAVSHYPNTGTFASAEEVARRLAPLISRGDVVCAQLPADAPVAYYLWRDVPAAEYALRPEIARMLFVDDARRNFGAGTGARQLITGSGYIVYQWDDGKDIPGSACWIPALLPAA